MFKACSEVDAKLCLIPTKIHFINTYKTQVSNSVNFKNQTFWNVVKEILNSMISVFNPLCLFMRTKFFVYKVEYCNS